MKRMKIIMLTVAAAAMTTVVASGCGFGNWGAFLGDLVGDWITLRAVD